MGTGTPVSEKDIITASKMNLKLETVAEEPTNKTTSRAFNTEYFNASPTRTISVIINAQQSLSGAGNCQLVAFTRKPPTPAAANNAITLGWGVAASIILTADLSFLVPPEHYYSVAKTDTGLAASTLNVWMETLI